MYVAEIKMAVFWVAVPCCLVKVYRRFIRAIALMMESASTSEAWLSFYQTTDATTQKTATFILAAVIA
jgi:hypothetical protein